MSSVVVALLFLVAVLTDAVFAFVDVIDVDVDDVVAVAVLVVMAV